MGNTGRLFIIVTLFILFSSGLHAQEGENLNAFLADDSPALMFQVSDLSLQSWNGGVGMMFSASEDVHWRFSLSPKFSGSDNSSSDTVYGPSEDNSTRLGVGISGGRFCVLYRKGSLCITAGPEVGYVYTNESRKQSRRNIIQSETTTGTHLLSLSGTFGAGYALSTTVMLHAEYLLGASYSFSSSDNTQAYGVVAVERSDWSLASSARLGLMIRL
ncbi:MAG: hypothetical protein IH600_06375 [Bacteroidetes bacterium]|nr:hypothetical protein [Bacteroidota bacterium]